MDPDKILADILEEIANYDHGRDVNLPRLAERFLVLDEWLSHGGFRPLRWRPVQWREACKHWKPEQIGGHTHWSCRSEDAATRDLAHRGTPKDVLHKVNEEG